MACLKTQKKWVRHRDKQQCQICGDVLPVHYGRLEVHHIDHRCKGRSDELENLVTLCDLCHAVIHIHMGPAWLGLSVVPIEKRQQDKQILDLARDEFESYLRLPVEKRHSIRKELWTQWGIMDKKGNSDHSTGNTREFQKSFQRKADSRRWKRGQSYTIHFKNKVIRAEITGLQQQGFSLTTR